MARCQRADCKHYGRSTKTCDYRLRNHIGRGCPIDGCTRYDKGSAKKKLPNPRQKKAYSLPSK